MCFKKDSSFLLIFSVIFSKKYDYLFGLGEKFGQFFWVPIVVECYQNKTGLDTSLRKHTISDINVSLKVFV